MAYHSVGVRVYGTLRAVDENIVPTTNEYYETQIKLDKTAPIGQEQDFLLHIKQEIETKEHVHVNFLSVDNKDLTVQWKSLGSPITISTIVTIIVITIALFALASVLNQTYHILSIFNPEQISRLMNIVILFLVLSMFSTILGAVPKRRG